ncbi:MAG: hypothetical protein AAGD25_01010 [Cyanobacteria bacterium P01_F01_bin.150]
MYKYLVNSLTENKNPTFLGHVLLSLALIISFCFCDLVASESGKRKQVRWMNVPDPRTFTQKSNDAQNFSENSYVIFDSILAEYNAEPAQKQVLRQYYSEILIRKYVHANILGYCFIRSYVTIIIITLGAFLMFFSAFFISREGWDKVNNAAINIFMVSTGIVFVYGSLMIGLKYEENIQKNGDIFIQYVNFSNEFLGFLVTNTSRDGQETSTEDFIIYTDLVLQQLSGIGINLDPKEVLRYQQNVNSTLNVPSGEQNNSVDTGSEEDK